MRGSVRDGRYATYPGGYWDVYPVLCALWPASSHTLQDTSNIAQAYCLTATQNESRIHAFYKPSHGCRSQEAHHLHISKPRKLKSLPFSVQIPTSITPLGIILPFLRPLISRPRVYSRYPIPQPSQEFGMQRVQLLIVLNRLSLSEYVLQILANIHIFPSQDLLGSPTSQRDASHPVEVRGVVVEGVEGVGKD